MFVYHKSYGFIESTFLKELMLVEEVHQKNVIYVTKLFFLDYSFKFQENVCNRCQMSMDLSNIAIVVIKGSSYHCITSLISKN